MYFTYFLIFCIQGLCGYLSGYHILMTSQYKPLTVFLKGEPWVLESTFQSALIKEIKLLFPGCIVLKNDANYIQGFPDLLILYKNKWAALECKKNNRESFQPNQEYYIEKLNEMSFAAVIFPENKEEILDELQFTFGVERPSRISERK